MIVLKILEGLALVALITLIIISAIYTSDAVQHANQDTLLLKHQSIEAYCTTMRICEQLPQTTVPEVVYAKALCIYDTELQRMIMEQSGV